MKYKKPSLSKLSDNQKREIIRIFHEETTPLWKVYKKYKISSKTLYKLLAPYRTKHSSLRNSTSPDKRKLNSEQIDELIKVYKEKKYSTKDLSKLFNIADHTLYRHLRARNIPLHEEVFKEDFNKKLQQVLILYKKDSRSVEEICKVVGIGSTAFYNFIRANKIKISRPRGPKKINRELLTKAFNYYKEGKYSIDEICKLTNVSITTFYKYFDEVEKKGEIHRRIKKPRDLLRDLTLKQKTLAIELYKKGEHTVPQICELIRISKQKLYKILEPERKKGLIARSEIYNQDGDKIRNAVELYKEGNLTLEEIQEETGISVYRIGEHIRKLRLSGVEIPERSPIKKLSQNIIDEAIELYRESGLSINEICDLTKISETSLYFYLLLRNEPLRQKKSSKRRQNMQKIFRKIINAYRENKYTVKGIEKNFNIGHHRDLYLALHSQDEVLRKNKLKNQYRKKFEYALSLYKKGDLTIEETCKKAKISPKAFLWRLKIAKKMNFTN